MTHQSAAEGASNSANHRTTRVRAIRNGILTALANRGVALVVAFLSVPLTIGYLGVERFGVWALMSSLLAWLRLADIGIGSGLNGAISSALALGRRDLVKEHVSTALLMLSGVAVIVASVSFVLVWWIDWAAVLGLRTSEGRAEIRLAMAVVVGIFALSLPLSVGPRVYNAMQMGNVANAWGVGGNLLSLVALVVGTRTEGGLPLLLLLVFGSTLISDALGFYWLFVVRRDRISLSWRAFSRSSMTTLLGTGVQFFITQMMALVVFEFDNFVIAHELGASDVGPYSIAYKLFSYSTLVQTIAFAYLWVAYSEAIARGDTDWVRRAFRWHVCVSVGLTSTVVAALIVMRDPIIRLWAGDAFVPSTTLVVLLALWNVINAYTSPLACLFAASDHMKAQVVYAGLSTVTNVTLSLAWVDDYGVNGVIAATVCAYLVFVCVPSALDLRRFLRRTLRAQHSV